MSPKSHSVADATAYCCQKRDDPQPLHLPPRDLPEELLTTLLQARGVRIERIVSRGHQSPDGFWYDQPTNEWVLVLKGAAKVEFADRTVEMGPGDYLDIPAHFT
jgi:cupin 2 domain-containing protein